MELFQKKNKKTEESDKKRIIEKRKKIKKKGESNRRRKLAEFIEKAGITIHSTKLSKRIFDICIIINILISGYLIYYFSVNEDYNLAYVLISMAFLWIIIFILILLILWLAFYLIIDLKIFKRSAGLDEVLPDFLQLTAANIRAGMAIDQALWHAIRPNFGVLAKEMENVAKQTMSGTDLEVALTDFASKYDSNTLKRSISLLVEGLKAGGEIGGLLDRIATNIQESRLLKKEMAASVTTYAIFISFAAILAAPFLLALSKQLLVVIGQIISSIDMPKGGAKMMFSLSKIGVKPSDFKIFAIVTLTVTSGISAAIIAVIKKGNVKAGIRYIPIFIFSTLSLFLIMDYILGIALSGIF